MSNNQLYWLFQASGWFLYWLLSTLYNALNSSSGQSFNERVETQIGLGIFVFSGLIATHLYRQYVVRKKWLQLQGKMLIIRLVASIFLLPLMILALHTPLAYVMGQLDLTEEWKIADAVAISVGLGALSSAWIMLYFGVQYFRNYKKAQIEELKKDAIIRDATLNTLRSQLNPHFIFNSLNSIRALVKMDPAKAREAITYLSNIIRKTLAMDEKSLTSFNDEIQLVKDYLQLEKIRYEDRLNIEMDFDELSKDYKLPPMLIQTLVENGIKHGISKIPKGGILSVVSKCENERLYITITNPGNLTSFETGKGYGLENSKRRLELLFGSEASLEQNSQNHLVTTTVKVPKL
ncbi:MAG: histidine kinase [Bacteroidetes bacterium]|nr:histidine kinase [Bacteroidota bacterium]